MGLRSQRELIDITKNNGLARKNHTKFVLVFDEVQNSESSSGTGSKSAARLGRARWIDLKEDLELREKKTIANAI